MTGDVVGADRSLVAPDQGLGRYELLHEVGRGGIGVVLRGRDRHLGRELAVKILRDAHQDKPDARRRFVATAQDLEQEQTAAPLLAVSHGEELAASGQPPKRCRGGPAGVRQGSRFRQAESRLRPRLRRAATTPRPPLVAMRARKP